MTNNEIKELILREYGKDELLLYSRIQSRVFYLDGIDSLDNDTIYDAKYWSDLSVELLMEKIKKYEEK